MKRCFRALLCLWLLTGLAACALGEPLTLTAELAEEVRIPLNDQADYVYSYRYPQADPADPSAELMNSFFQDKAKDAVGFDVPMSADYYAALAPEADIRMELSYQVTCNREDYFGVLVETVQEELTTYTGYTFSRLGVKPGASVALPYLLGLLDSEETDSWLQDRQTGKADALVRQMVWDALQEREDVQLAEGVDPEWLEYSFFPEEDFYLDEQGNPVFYLQPGAVEDSDRLITVPISIEEILDEM